MSDRKRIPIDPNQVQPGDLLAITHYVRVDQVSPDADQMSVTDLDRGHPLSIEGSALIKSVSSADTFAETQTVSKTRAAELLMGSVNGIFTVAFITDKGKNRVLRGRLVATNGVLGRCLCEDLDRPPNDRLRWVDNRTIDHLIVDGVRYVVRRS